MEKRTGLGLGLLLAALAGAAYVLLTERPEDPGPVDGAPREAGAPPAPGPTLVGRAADPGRLPSTVPAALPAPLPEDANTIVLVGRVVDDRRRPVVGAALTARIDTFAEAGVLSGEGGRFRLPIGPLPPRDVQGSVLVVGPGGTAALGSVWVGAKMAAREIDLGVLTLLPAGGLLVRVERDGAPVADASVAVRSLGSWTPTRVALARSDARGEVRLAALPPGTYRCAALASGHGRAAGQATVQAGAQAEVRLALGPSRTVDVLVVDKASEAPVPGATVTLQEMLPTQSGMMQGELDPPLEVPPTDATGHTRLEGLGAGDRPQLRATAEGYAGRSAGQFGDDARPVTLAADATEVRLAIERLVPLRWPIKPGDPLAPPEGTRLPVEPDPSGIGASLPQEVRVEGGFLVADGFSTGPIHAFAVAPDGVYARLFRLPAEADGREVAFQRERRIDVRVLTAEGAPVTGLYVSARSQGNNPLGTPTLVDADGRAVLRLKHPYLVEVYASRTRDAWSGSVLGSADLRQGDARVEGSLAAVREVLLSVRLQGKPGLPGSFSVGAGMQQAEVLEEDPEAGTLRLRLALPAPQPGGKPPMIWMRAAGFAPATAEVSGLEGAGPLTAAMDLEPAGVLLVRVKLPADGRVGRVLLQRYDPARGEWTHGGAQPVHIGPAGAGNAGAPQRHEGLAVGRYRAVAPECGDASPAAEVVGGRETEVLLDLSLSGEVTGTVEVPEGFDVRQTTLRLDLGDLGRTFGSEPGRAFVRPDGTFSLRVPGTRAVALAVRHPLLRPDAASAGLVLERPQPGLRVRLVAGPTARFTLPGVKAARSDFPGSGGLKVLLFAGAPEGKPLMECDPQPADEAWVLGGFEPGTYTLWIDTGSTAPVVRRGVVLGEGVTDLGALETSPGTTVRVRVKAREGTAVPRLSVWAVHQGEPAYQRGTNSRGGPEDVLVTGLGAGRFRVTGGAVMGVLGVGARGFALDQTIDVNGSGEVVLDLDLR